MSHHAQRPRKRKHVTLFMTRAKDWRNGSVKLESVPRKAYKKVSDSTALLQHPPRPVAQVYGRKRAGYAIRIQCYFEYRAGGASATCNDTANQATLASPDMASNPSNLPKTRTTSELPKS